MLRHLFYRLVDGPDQALPAQLSRLKKELAGDAETTRRAEALTAKQTKERERRTLAEAHGLTVNQIIAIEETRDRRLKEAAWEPPTQPKVIPYPVKTVNS